MSSRFKFKVWDTKRRLLTRPGTVNFVRGELVIPDCVILQYSGCSDMMDQEIFEDDILLIGERKYKVIWDEKDATWKYTKEGKVIKLTQEFTATTIRSYNANERIERE